MVNQVGNISNTNNSPFNNFTQYRKDKNFFISEKNLIKAEEEKSHKVIITLGASALILGFGILLLMRGPKGTNKFLSRIKNFLEKKVAQTKSSKTGTALDRFYLSSLNKVNSFIEKCESINNFTSIKDAVCKKIMYKKNWSKKLYKKITNLFERTSRETVVASWTNTKHRLSKTFKNLEKLDDKILQENGAKDITINGVTKKGSEWVEILRNSRKDIFEILGANVNKNKSTARYKRIKTATQNLDDVTIEIFKDVRNKDLYQTFAADRVILKDKADLYDEMNLFRQAISFNRHDKLEMARNILKKIEGFTVTDDYNLLTKFNTLKSNLKNGVSDKELLCNIDELREALQKGRAKIDAQNYVFERLDKVKELISTNRTGKMEEMLAIYKRLLPEDYAKIEKQTSHAVKSIDKSINIEAEQFYDKVRDLQIGSAPTDALSILGSAAMIGVGLAKAKDNDERISVTLKAGIPVIGAVATSLYCTARLVSGGKAMGVGLVSGWILNRIGEIADKFRKKLTEKPAESGTNAL